MEGGPRLGSEILVMFLDLSVSYRKGKESKRTIK